MMSIKQKMIALGTLLVMNVVFLIFTGPLVIYSLIFTVLLAIAIIRR